jgi:phage shock protein C
LNFPRRGKRWGRLAGVFSYVNVNQNVNEWPYRMDIFHPQIYNSPMALTLSNNRMIAGVCGGLAEWLGWDPTLVRILYTLITIFTAFSGVIVYLVLWVIMPRKSG